MTHKATEFVGIYLNRHDVGGGGWCGGWVLYRPPPFLFFFQACLRDLYCSCFSGAALLNCTISAGSVSSARSLPIPAMPGEVPQRDRHPIRETPRILLGRRFTGLWPSGGRPRPGPCVAGTTQPGRLPAPGLAATCHNPHLAAALRPARADGAVLHHPGRPESALKEPNVQRAAPPGGATIPQGRGAPQPWSDDTPPGCPAARPHAHHYAGCDVAQTTIPSEARRGAARAQLPPPPPLPPRPGC